MLGLHGRALDRVLQIDLRALEVSRLEDLCEVGLKGLHGDRTEARVR